MPKVARDAVTGEFVTMEYARENPDTTVVETVPEHLAREAPSTSVAPDAPEPPPPPPESSPPGDTNGANTTRTVDRPW